MDGEDGDEDGDGNGLGLSGRSREFSRRNSIIDSVCEILALGKEFNFPWLLRVLWVLFVF